MVLCNTFNIFLDLISYYFMKDFCIFKGVVLVYSFHLLYFLCWASLVTQTVKNLAAVQETQVPSLGQEDPLEKGMAPHSSILAWGITWTEEPGGYSR